MTLRWLLVLKAEHVMDAQLRAALFHTSARGCYTAVPTSVLFFQSLRSSPFHALKTQLSIFLESLFSVL